MGLAKWPRILGISAFCSYFCELCGDTASPFFANSFFSCVPLSHLLTGVLLTAASLVLPAPALAQKAAPRPEVGQIPEVYTDGKKCKVTIVRYGPREAE